MQQRDSVWNIPHGSTEPTTYMIIVNTKGEYSSTPNNYLTMFTEWAVMFLCLPVLGGVMKER